MDGASGFKGTHLDEVYVYGISIYIYGVYIWGIYMECIYIYIGRWGVSNYVI